MCAKLILCPLSLLIKNLCQLRTLTELYYMTTLISRNQTCTDIKNNIASLACSTVHKPMMWYSMYILVLYGNNIQQTFGT